MAFTAYRPPIQEPCDDCDDADRDEGKMGQVVVFVFIILN